MFFKLSALTAICVTVLFLGSCGKETSTPKNSTPKTSTHKASALEASTPEASAPKVTDEIYSVSNDEASSLGQCLSGKQDKCEQGEKAVNKTTYFCNKGNKVACKDLEVVKELISRANLHNKRIASVSDSNIAMINCKQGIERQCVRMMEIQSKLVEWCNEKDQLGWCERLSTYR